jgi:hypothetical protein
MTDISLAAVFALEDVNPGLLVLVMFLVIAVGIVVLWRSLNTQLRRIDFDEPDDSPDGDQTEGQAADADR